MEHNHIANLIANRTCIRVYIVNGFQMTGCIADQDDAAIILDTGRNKKLIYKSAISTIEPVGV